MQRAAEAGLDRVDPVIALLESVHVHSECAKIMLREVSQLMDVAIGGGHLQQVRDIVSGNPDVREVGDVKGRHSGRGISLDIEVKLDGRRTVRESYATVREVQALIRDSIAQVQEI